MRADEELDYVEYVHSRALSLRRTAFRLCGDWHYAYDLTQTALIRLFQHWPQVRQAGAIDAYVRRILVNAFLEDQRRWWQRRVRVFADLPDGPVEPSNLDGRLDLMAALARLAPGQRAVLVLRYWEGLDVRATAEVLGCSEGTVKSQTAHALAAMRRLMPDYVSDGRQAQ